MVIAMTGGLWVECDECHVIYWGRIDAHDIGEPNVCCGHCAWVLSHTEGEPQPPHTCVRHPFFKDVDTFLRLRHPMKVYYFSYAYTRNPPEMTLRVQRKVLAILAKRDDIVALVPHFFADMLLARLAAHNSQIHAILPVGYTHPETCNWEVTIIGRCDAIVWEPSVSSVGVNWECAIAQKLGKPLFTYDEVLEGRDLE